MSGSICTFAPGDRLRFDYINHEGKLTKRDVLFRALDYGTNEWYPEPQWFMRCHDLERGAARSFALSRIEGDAVVIAELAPPPIAGKPYRNRTDG